MRPIRKEGGICFTQSINSNVKFNMNCSNIILDLSPRVMEIKTKINKWDLIKLKNFCIAKKTINKTKRQPIEWVANDVTDKGLISKICK